MYSILTPILSIVRHGHNFLIYILEPSLAISKVNYELLHTANSEFPVVSVVIWEYSVMFSSVMGVAV